jgi:5'-nucleotidase
VIIQPFSHGKYIGWAMLPLGGGQGEIKGLQPVCAKVVTTPKGKSCDPFQIKFAKGPAETAIFMGKDIEPDQETADLLAPELNKVKELKETPLGFQALEPIARAFNGESALGNMIADISKESVSNADIGLANGGGLRANISKGPVTYGSIFALLPFDNQTAIMKVPGAKLTELVKVGLFGGVGTYGWSSNLSLVADGCELKELKIDGCGLSKEKQIPKI